LDVRFERYPTDKPILDGLILLKIKIRLKKFIFPPPPIALKQKLAQFDNPRNN
jgi:hypothetical protein